MTELPQYRRILLATDGSELAELAARHAVALARQTGAQLVALCVVDTHQAFGLGIYRQEAIDELRRDGKKALQSVAELGREAGLEVETELRDGRPGECIVHAADQLGADLIVVGSFGQSALADILLGSVSQYVVQHARVPVLVTHPPRSA